MNTLTAIGAAPATPQQDAPGSGQTSAADARAGFTDLVNLFLTPLAEPATGLQLDGNSDGRDGSPEPQAASALPLRTPHEIAGALIHLMSARATPATNAFSDAPKSKSIDSKPDRKQRESTFIDGAALLPGSLPFEPVAQHGVAGGSGSGRLSIPVGMTLEAAKAASGSAAPLAFALKLTPHDSATADPDSLPAGGAQSSAPHDRSSSDLQQVSSEFQAGKATRELLLEAEQVADSSSSGAIAGFSPSTAMISPNPGIAGRSDGGQPAQLPAPSPADALRSRAETAPGPPAKSTAAQEIAVRIARPEAASVDVHLIQRAGQVHVSVRTPDPGLQTSLRQDLGALVNSLERAGYKAEALPHDALSAQSPMRADSHAASPDQQPSRDRQESGGGWASSGRDGSGQPGGGSGGQRRQDQGQREPQDWTEALEDTK